MGSRLFNFIANTWSPSKAKKTSSGEAIDANMSGQSTPATFVESHDGASRQESTPPSSPIESGSVEEGNTDTMGKRKKDIPADDAQDKMEVDAPEAGEDEDTEGMDMKAKALTKLLKTSSVSLYPRILLIRFLER
jgi:ATP-dependent DNA helicase